jgi:hypothetical protein
MVRGATARIYPFDAQLAEWAQAAEGAMRPILRDPEVRRANLRHAETWFVGVDALPNDAQGRVSGVELVGAWRADVPDMPLHRAQVSVIFPGYPKRDKGESLPNHQFRVKRRAAHVDGLLPEGPDKRRYAREFHAYILGIPLNDVAASPTVVWEGSERIMQAALRAAVGGRNISDVDLTDAYQAARREVFETCKMVPLHAEVGESFLIHRFALHGTDVWNADLAGPTGEGRMIAFFRPDFGDSARWLAPD